MKDITINGIDYKLEYQFEAAEHKQLIQNAFNIMSGAYIVRRANEDGTNLTEATFDGTADMVSDLIPITIDAFYAGLLEHHPEISQREAKGLMKTYMKENKVGYSKLWQELKTCMEDDGFFDLSGLTDMLEEMNKNAEEVETEEEKVKTAKQPQDHKKKQTSTK